LYRNTRPLSARQKCQGPRYHIIGTVLHALEKEFFLSQSLMATCRDLRSELGQTKRGRMSGNSSYGVGVGPSSPSCPADLAQSTLEPEPVTDCLTERMLDVRRGAAGGWGCVGCCCLLFLVPTGGLFASGDAVLLTVGVFLLPGDGDLAPGCGGAGPFAPPACPGGRSALCTLALSSAAGSVPPCDPTSPKLESLDTVTSSTQQWGRGGEEMIGLSSSSGKDGCLIVMPPGDAFPVEVPCTHVQHSRCIYLA
jgi:hypothetical protein